MTYEDDKIAKYLAMRVLDDRDGVGGISYETAITSTRTTKESIDWWLNELSPIGE